MDRWTTTTTTAPPLLKHGWLKMQIHPTSCVSGSLFQRSTIPTNPMPNPKADANPITLILTLTLNLTQTLALWHVSAQWTIGILDLRNSRPVPILQLSVSCCLMCFCRFPETSKADKGQSSHLEIC